MTRDRLRGDVGEFCGNGGLTFDCGIDTIFAERLWMRESSMTTPEVVGGERESCSLELPLFLVTCFGRTTVLMDAPLSSGLSGGWSPSESSLKLYNI